MTAKPKGTQRVAPSASTAFAAALVVAVTTVLGCTTSPEAAGAGGQSKTVETATPGQRTLCTDPRPQICTREYLPVCGELKTGGTKTYATGCTACSDAAVAAHRAGACPGDEG